MQLQQVTSKASTSSISKASSLATTAAIGDGENHDYELFLEKARREEEKKERSLLRAMQEAERKRRTGNMDPWAARMGKI